MRTRSQANPASNLWLAPRPLRTRNRIGFEADAHAGRSCEFAPLLPCPGRTERTARCKQLRPVGSAEEWRAMRPKRRMPRLKWRQLIDLVRRLRELKEAGERRQFTQCPDAAPHCHGLGSGDEVAEVREG